MAQIDAGHTGWTARRGMTLVEMLIALVVVSLVAAAATSMLFATVSATSATSDVRKDVVRVTVVSTRLHEEIHAALAFLASGENELVLWADDDNASGTVNLDEIVLIQRDSGTNALHRFRVSWPTGWSQATIDAANTSYAASSNFSSVASAAKSLAHFTGTLWSSTTTAFTPQLDNGTALSSRLVTITLTLTESGTARTSYVTAGLRSAATPN